MKKVIIYNSENQQNKRIALGIEHLEKALTNQGYTIEHEDINSDFVSYSNCNCSKIYVGLQDDKFIAWLDEQEILIYHSGKPAAEGFYIQSCPSELTVISAADDTGALYGCLELCDRIEKSKDIPHDIAFGEAPAFKLRGPAVGLQKTKLEPPRLTYEYPITPSRFPWFYDKSSWQEFLDMMLQMRCNVIYIWSGHPFSSLVQLEEYPEALEVTQEEFELNQEIFGWLTEECDRRGIWVVLKFYNIHIPLPFARKHGLELLQSNINPIVQDYTSKIITKFITAFPNIGLMVCLGEALRGTQNKTDWFIKTIIPAVKEGVKQAGLLKEPPLILRGHDCDPYGAMQEAMKIYSNLYTMWKYNGESLTTYLPRGKWRDTHLSLSGLGSTHIMNVHILANLEPFQFSAPSYIQKCVQAGSERYGVNALHLYPLFYWDWPYTPDKAEPRIKQTERDWIWYKAWFRYAFNPNRNEQDEQLYWTNCIAEHYGCDNKTATLLLVAMESAGQLAPKILGRVGITEGNRQTMSLGMTMSQLTNVTKYRPNRELWYSVARKGEQPDDYIQKKLRGEPHLGETPYDMMSDVLYHAKTARESIEQVKLVLGNNEEFSRIYSDILALELMTKSYCDKISAAMYILEYKYTMDENCLGNTSLLTQAQDLMESSLVYYRELAQLTEKTYLYANSMQTPQRKIPFPNGEHFGHWTQCLPKYEEEFVNFNANVKELQAGIAPKNSFDVDDITALKGTDFILHSNSAEKYTLQKGESIFADSNCKIQNICPEVVGLTGIRMGLGKSIEGGETIKLELLEDCKILIGYINAKGVEWLQLPDLETNTHADDRGGLAIVFENAMKAEGCPAINIHAFNYEKGVHEIYLGTGGYMIAGVISADTTLKPRNAGMENEGFDTLDWLYSLR